MIPPKLKKGNHIRVIAPAETFPPGFEEEKKQKGIELLEGLGLRVSFGRYVNDYNNFSTTSVENRLKDLHDAIADPEVHALISLSGGSSGNQLLKHIDYDLVRNNPKIFCGLSDNTEFTNAFYAKAGLVTYNGPNFTTLAQGRLTDYSVEYMRRSFFSTDAFEIQLSDTYCNSKKEHELLVNEGHWTINPGEAEAICMGGNLMTCNFMLGNRFMPSIKNTILFLEENHLIDYKGVEKEIQEILNHPDSAEIKGLLLGRFQRETEMTRELLTELIHSKPELKNIPVIGNVDFGHTVPTVTLPFGGRIRMKAASDDLVSIEIIEH